MDRSGRKVLVVEDEPILRSLAVEILADGGYEPLEAGSGEEALEILRERWPEVCLVFTDVNMAGEIDGLRLAQVVASSWPSISILITSGRGAPRQEEMPSNASFTPKPWRRSMLVDRVEEVCFSSRH
jgi:two-component system, response regulator PdtaR